MYTKSVLYEDRKAFLIHAVYLSSPDFATTHNVWWSHIFVNVRQTFGNPFPRKLAVQIFGTILYSFATLIANLRNATREQSEYNVDFDHTRIRTSLGELGYI